MAITLKNLMDDDSLFEKLKLGNCKCARCGVALQETITGKRKSPMGAVCSDCYYAQLGDGIEEHPIQSPRVRRG